MSRVTRRPAAFPGHLRPCGKSRPPGAARSADRLPATAALTLSLTVSLLCSLHSAACTVQPLHRGETLAITLTDPRPLYSRSIEGRLLLRIVKERSIASDHFGWNVEVVPLPSGPHAENLVYANPDGLGPDPSMLHAWQVADDYYPDRRTLAVRGSPYVIHAHLDNPRVTGRELKAAFTSGTLRISWEKQASAP
jgi:hypothetical protein